MAPCPSAAADGVPARVEGDDVVLAVAVDAVHHVAAHLAEADEPDPHQKSLRTRSVRSRSDPAGSPPSSVTFAAGRPWAPSVCRSPTAWARSSGPNPYGRPGIVDVGDRVVDERRGSGPSVGPPLWNWPVECR